MEIELWKFEDIHLNFTHAIVKTPGKSMSGGLTSANLGAPNYELALTQHKLYCDALRKCNVQIQVLDAEEQYPDSTFVEDTALVTKHCAIITNPGADSRKGETVSIRKSLGTYFQNIESICAPGTVDAGDIMMVGDHFYIGLSSRTNAIGAMQMITMLHKYGFTGETVEMPDLLHLKSGLSYLENGNLLIDERFINRSQFKKLNLIDVPVSEAYAANSLWINESVLVPAGFPQVRSEIETAGYTTIELDMSEFRKLDGGLSCLSLRFSVNKT